MADLISSAFADPYYQVDEMPSVLARSRGRETLTKVLRDARDSNLDLSGTLHAIYQRHGIRDSRGRADVDKARHFASLPDPAETLATELATTLGGGR